MHLCSFYYLLHSHLGISDEYLPWHAGKWHIHISPLLVGVVGLSCCFEGQYASGLWCGGLTLLSILWVALSVGRMWVRVCWRIAHLTIALLIDHATLLARVL